MANNGDGEDTAAVDGGWNLPTDAFVEILLRLPPTKRWVLRLVCRHWRDVIRERTPPPEELALAFVVNYSDDTPKQISAAAYAIDDPAEGRCREVWRSKLLPPIYRFSDYSWRYEYIDASKPAMVGSCNGLLCLCDNKRPGGAIALLNPATGDRLVVPPLPGSAQWVHSWTGIRDWHEAYSFTYHPDTGRYKIVHVPCYLDRSGGFSEMQVFTLGEPSWRDVPVPGASGRIDAGLVSIDGVLYWVSKDTDHVVSFDLNEERVTSTVALPVWDEQGYAWRLAVVRGRLGAVSSHSRNWRVRRTPEKIEVWILGAGRDQQGWSRRYSVQIGVRHQLAWPHFAHGDQVLIVETSNNNSYVFAHRMRVAQGGEVRSIHITERGQFLSGMSCSSIRGVFAYVKTEEPLSVYTTQKLHN